MIVSLGSNLEYSGTAPANTYSYLYGTYANSIWGATPADATALSEVYGSFSQATALTSIASLYGGWSAATASAGTTSPYAIAHSIRLNLNGAAAVTNYAAALELNGTANSTDGTDTAKIFKLKASQYGRSLIDQPRDTDYALELTNGKGLLVTGKTDQLQLAKAAGGAKPTCDATARGSVWYEPGGAGVLDTLELCRKDASNNYAWVSLF